MCTLDFIIMNRSDDIRPEVMEQVLVLVLGVFVGCPIVFHMFVRIIACEIRQRSAISKHNEFDRFG